MHPFPSRAAPLLLAMLGFATAVAQALLLREAMAALGGSELAWGAVLAVWLAGMGAGAWLGSRTSRTALAAAGPSLVLVLATGGVVLLRAVPALVGASSGEAVATARAVWVWVTAVLPAALAGGWSFPSLAASLAGDSAAAFAYAWESGGAMAGGAAFTFVLAPLGAGVTLLAASGCTLAGWLVLQGRRWLAIVPLVAIVFTAAPFDTVLARAGWRWSGRIGALAVWSDTREQRLELAAGSPAALYADGRFVGAFPDPYRAGARTHLALLLLPSPHRVLLVGGLEDGSLPAALRHPIQRITVAEEDPALPRLLRRWIGGALAAALDDPRVTVWRGDPLGALRSGARWDVILLADPDPTTLRRNRTRTVEFARACRDALTARGALVVRVGVSDTYLGGAGGRLVAVLSATLHEVFPRVVAVPGEEVLLVGTADDAELSVDPAVLEQRVATQGINDPEFPAAMVRLLVDPGRVPSLADFLRRDTASPNRAARPRAVLLAAALHEARGSPPLLVAARALAGTGVAPLVIALIAVAAFLLVRGLARARLGIESAVVVGFASMGWWLLLLAAWQATRGAVYTEVGALSALLMAGLTVGAWWARKRAVSPRLFLAVIVGLGALLSGLIAAGLPLAWPRAAIVPMLVLAGFLTGASFPSVATLAGTARGRHGIGRGFAADEAGAAGAALLVGLLILPWAGMLFAALAIAGVQLATSLSLVLAGRR
ncbi:MAG: hypothetical protein ACHQQS_01915 [Thermoanaerobaculales bacterium]